MNEDKDRLGRLLRKNLIEEYKRIAKEESIEEITEEEVRRLKEENEALKSLSMNKPWTVEEYEKVYTKDYYEGKIVHEVRIFGLEIEKEELERKNKELEKENKYLKEVIDYQSKTKKVSK